MKKDLFAFCCQNNFVNQLKVAAHAEVDSFISHSHRVQNLENRVDEATEKAVVDYAVEYPAYGQFRRT